MKNKLVDPLIAPLKLLAKGRGLRRATAQDQDTETLQRALRNHQAELEMQNEDLRRTQLELARARDRFADLYDGAPVGYFTLNHEGRVIETNRTGAALLDTGRDELGNMRLSSFIVPDDGDRWGRHMMSTLKHEEAQRIELRIQRGNGTVFDGQLDCQRVIANAASPTLRVVLTDVSERKQAEMAHHLVATTVEAREVERRRVSRELHEELGQQLSALKMDVSSLRAPASAHLPSTAPDFDSRVGNILSVIDEAIASIRRIATDLRPLMLDDLGLYAAIDWLARDTARRSGLQITVRMEEGDAVIDEPTSVTMYRMVQETLADIGARRSATDVLIEIEQSAGELVLVMEDNASDGAAGANEPRDSLVLHGLRERAHAIGGELTVETTPGGGGRRTVRLPLARAGAALTHTLPA